MAGILIEAGDIMGEAVGHYQCPTASNHTSLLGGQLHMAIDHSTQTCARCGKVSPVRSSRKTGRKYCSTECYKTDRPSRLSQYAWSHKSRVHVSIATAALGKPLPRGAQVHHVDSNTKNNAHVNLVICQDAAYHGLLHVRTRVVKAGGDPNTQRICTDCKQLKLLTEMTTARGRLQNQCKRCVADRAMRRYNQRRAVTNPVL